MPTYDYECSNGHGFEALQSITAEPLAECITCGAPVRRLIGGGAGIIFKGSGFYVTDSKNGKSAKQSDKEETATAADGATKDASKKSDAKPTADSSASGGDKQTKPAAAT